MTFELKSFEALTLNELYSTLRLRSEVFVVEQDCPYQDLDNKDKLALHVLCKSEDDQLLGYTRILDRGISYNDYTSIGRVVVAQVARKSGVGRELMVYSINSCFSKYNQIPIKISAQHHLQNWYESLGFDTVGDVYLEDNIPHIAMILMPKI